MAKKKDIKEQNSDIQQDRLPPQSIEAEQSVLGAIMIDKKAIIRVSDFYVQKVSITDDTS